MMLSDDFKPYVYRLLDAVEGGPPLGCEESRQFADGLVDILDRLKEMERSCSPRVIPLRDDPPKPGFENVVALSDFARAGR